MSPPHRRRAPVAALVRAAEPPAEPRAARSPSLADFVALPRIGALALSADGSRLAVSVQTLDPEKKKWQSALWEVDPAGAAARRGGSPAARPASPPRCGRRTARCCSPPPVPTPAPRENGEPEAGAVEPARRRRRGPAGARPARRDRRVHGRRRQRRRRRGGRDHARAARTPRRTRSGARSARTPGSSAILHESYPIRHWDHDLGPAVAAPVLGRAAARGGTRRAARDAVELRDLTPEAAPPAGAGEDARAVPRRRACWPASEEVPDGPAGRRSRLVAHRAPAAASPACSSTTRWPTSTRPRFSPDGATVVCVRETLSTYAEPPDYTLLLVDVADGHASRSSPRASTGGRARRSSAPTARRSTSWPTTTAGTPSSGCPWPAASRCG